MKKSSKNKRSSKGRGGVRAIGLDLSDRTGRYHAIDGEGKTIESGTVRLIGSELQRWASGMEPTVIAVEAGTHSPWVSRLLQGCGHEVVVANPVKVALITKNVRKSDAVDAEYLARLVRVDRELLHPIRHRGEQAQTDLQMIRTRDVAVQVRTKLVGHVRGAVKSFGTRLPSCSTDAFVHKTRGAVPMALRAALEPIYEQIEQLSKTIGAYDRQVQQVAAERYPEVERITQIKGVGVLTGLTFVLVLEDAGRFRRSRSVGAYLGLTSRREQSGQEDPQRGITKAGDQLLRRLLIQGAHYILGPFGEDSDLRRHGEQLSERGGQRARKRATVAVARKLAVLMHRLWVSGETYEPLRNSHLVSVLQPAA